MLPNKACLLAFLLLLRSTIHLTAAIGVSVGVGGGFGVGVGIGNGNGNVGNGNTPSEPPSSKLESAYKALQAWKSAISDDPLKLLDSWVGPNVCSYKGVFCSPPQDDEISSLSTSTATANVVVAGIDLNHANLQGTLVKELSLLVDMSLLHLNSNRFSGTVPDTFKDLVSLEELDLSNNHLSGPFPIVTLYMPSLLYLDLRFNLFSGQLPDELFNRKLDAIFLNNNQFQGEIPQSLGNSPASVINLANNKLSGNIPTSFGLMGNKLKEVLFLNNQLTGCIPEGVGLFDELEVFDVSFNSLMGHLPDTISCLQDIEVLNLGHNKLSGELSDVICSLTSLVNLTVAYNFFSGLSQQCSRLFNIGFDFSGNCIPGRDMQRPQPECSVIPGGTLNCLRIPTPRPLVCASLPRIIFTNNMQSSSQHTSSSSYP
ncbi:leucine-rich repeat extensin-like protein 6 [Arachis duranensis]|uniref:Cell wall hydroxyproline-rich glycoprotein n=1 Tax=Arachis duranensis TaxID=130453 RepID=A0A6P4CPD7_ARADU|nr:leucine-rich repeat extensin-like protein 6 [Arachis duranensis]